MAFSVIKGRVRGAAVESESEFLRAMSEACGAVSAEMARGMLLHTMNDMAEWARVNGGGLLQHGE